MGGNDMKKVLVVEDDEIVRDVCVEALSGAGYEAECAADGVEGLEKIRKASYDLIISDIYMPRLGGIGVYINSVWDNARLKERFLFMTGNISDDARAAISQLNIKYLLKPFKVVDLLLCAESIIERAEMHDSTDRFHNGRRRDVRFSIQKEADVCIENAGDPDAPRSVQRSVKTTELSRNGLRVAYEGAPLSPGTALSVSISMNSVSLTRSASVVWSKGMDGMLSVSGLEFTRAVPVQSLSKAFAVSQ